VKRPAKKPVDLFETHHEPVRPQREVMLFQEPDEQPLVLGLIMQDSELIQGELRACVRKSPADYRSGLRVIMGAADRIKKRCTRLLGEDK
jgi:hypothetical protein